ncbi:restriction endonuclease subunit S [Vibrio fluvialis]|uniref:restriction endonuclease subunit S n=1 Tax=Vibrio fluvialis TaxID=676 RepID=UPI001EEA198F|nr:restriction endonuclease subunit S [Vibrio fluvialis]MCG6399339.1 restriction endonuclease subunit S [Vibrio fluvialis]
MAKLQPLNDKNRGEFKAIFSVPEHWTVEYAHFAFNEVRDGTHDSPKQFEGEGYPLVTSKNLKSYGLDFQNTKNISAEDHFEISKRSKVETGDILFSMIGTIGNVSIIEDKTDFSIKNVGLFRKSQSLLTEKFSYYWLKSNTYQSWLSSRERGGTQKFVSLGTLRESPILIAPLPEQKRIVEKLDEVLAQVDTIKARLDGIPELLKRFRQSVLASAVSGKLTEEWREKAMFDKPVQKSLGDVITKIGQGWSPKCESTPAENGEWGVIKTSSVQNISFIEHENKALPKSLDARPEHELLVGDILTTRAGPRVRCGVTAYVDMTRSNLMICDKVYRYRVKESEGFSKYLVYLLNAPQYLAEIEKMKTGISDSGMNLTQSKFKQLPLFWPHIEEQKEIVRLVDQYFAFADTIEAQVKKAQVRVDNLTQSILAKAFRGELVAQDPNDEPAEVLLKRIAKARAEAEQLAKAAKKAGKKKA